MAVLMYNTATLMSGYSLNDNVNFAQQIEAMMRQTLGVDADEMVDEQACQKEPHNKYNDFPEVVERKVPHESCWDEPEFCADVAREACEEVPSETCRVVASEECRDVPRQEPHQVTKYVDVKPVTKTSCNDHVENVPRQKANEGWMARP